MDTSNFKIGANSVQLMCKPEGIVTKDGIIGANLTLTGEGFQARIDSRKFPFLSAEHPCLVVISIMQIRPEEQAIEVPSSKLIVPNGGKK